MFGSKAQTDPCRGRDRSGRSSYSHPSSRAHTSCSRTADRWARTHNPLGDRGRARGLAEGGAAAAGDAPARRRPVVPAGALDTAVAGAARRVSEQACRCSRPASRPIATTASPTHTALALTPRMLARLPDIAETARNSSSRSRADRARWARSRSSRCACRRGQAAWQTHQPIVAAPAALKYSPRTIPPRLLQGRHARQIARHARLRRGRAGGVGLGRDPVAGVIAPRIVAASVHLGVEPAGQATGLGPHAGAVSGPHALKQNC